ncbi:Ig-like domain-containing protein [Ancylomarina sp. YFZ004]
MIKPLLSFLCLFLLLLVQNVSAQTSLSVSSIEASPDDEVVISVNIENDEVFNAFQFDLCFPDQLSWRQESGILSNRADGHTLSVDLVEPGRLRIISYSMSLAEFSGITGEVFQTSFVVGKEPGTWSLTPENATIGGVSGNIVDHVNAGAFTLLAPNLVVSPDVINFGEVPIGENKAGSLMLQNAGNQELNVTGFTFADSRFSSSDAQSFIIPAGVSRSLNLNFKSETIGQIESSIIIHSNQVKGDVIAQLQGLAYAVNEIHLLTASGHSGQEVEVPITLNNMEPFTGFQFSIPLPDVATFVKGSAKLNSERITDHVLSADITNQNLTIIAYSPSNAAFIGNDGQIMTVRLYLEGQGGNYSLTPQKAIIADSEGKNIISANYGANLRVKAPRISVGTSLIDFAKVSSLETQSRDLVIHNNGDAELRIDELVFGDSHFSTTRELPILIPSYGSETISIQFSAEDALLHESFLRIRSNDVERDPMNIQLRAQSYFPNELQVVDAWFQAASRDTLYVNLFNQEGVSGFQFDMVFPSGLTPASSEVFLTDRKSDHALVASELSSDKIRLLCWSGSLSVFSGTDGLVVGIPVDIAADVTGTHNLHLSDVVISNEKGASIESGSSDGTLTIGMDLSKVAYHIAEGKLLNTTAAMEYAMGDDNWKSCSEGATSNVLFIEGDLKIREQAKPGNIKLIASLARPEGPIIQIDFKNETTRESIPDNVSYAIDANMSENLYWGSNQLVALTPGQNLYFRIKASSHKLPSRIVKLTVPIRPDSPRHTIDYESEQTFEIVGLNEAYSTDGFVNDNGEGTGDPLVLSPGDDIWFYYQATVNSFRSNKVKLEVKARPNKPVFTVNYSIMETSELIPDNVEFATDAAYSINYGVGASQAIALIDGSSYWFRVKASNANEYFRSESSQLQVVPIPAAPQCSIDYLNEQTAEEMPENVEYAEDDQFTQNVRRGTETRIAVVPGTDLWFRVAQTENSPSGEISHLVVPQRPAVPVHTIDYESEQTFEIVSTNEAYSTDAFVNDIKEGTGDRLVLSPGNAVWFSYPATVNSFRSNKVKLAVKARPLKPVFTVNYSIMETSELIPDNVEFATDAAYSINYGIGASQSIALIDGSSYWFRVKASNVNEQFRSESSLLQVAPIPAAPHYTIDYQNEQTAEEIPENVEYAEDDQFTQNVRRGTGTRIAVVPGTDLWFRVAQTENSPSGEISHLLVFQRPIVPVHSIDYESEQTSEIVAVNEEYSSDGFVNDIKEGTGDRLDLNPGNAVWFSYPATGSSFRSDKVKLEVKVRPATPVFTVDYAQMKTYEMVLETIEYASNSMFTQNYGVGKNEAIPMTIDLSYWFRVMASNTNEQFRSENYQLDVSTIPAAPQFTINYLNEQTAQEIPEIVEYAEDDQFTQNVRRGTGAIIAVLPGTDLWFRVAQTENNPLGEISHLEVPQRPTVPIHTIDYESEQTFEVVATNEAYSSDAFVTESKEGTGDLLDLSPGNAVWFSYPATDKSFCSDKVKLEVKARPAKPVFTVDYARMETSGIVAETIEYANDEAYTYRYGLGTGQAISLTGGTNYWFRVKASNESEQFRSESSQLQVAPIPAAPNYTIDYLNEQTAEEIPENVEYAEDDQFTQNVRRGTGAIIAVLSGTDLWFRVVQTENSSSGEISHLVVSQRPTVPVHTIDYESEQTFEIIVTNEAYSSDAFVNESKEGTGDRLVLSPGNDIWFSYPATDKSFCSDKVKLEVKARPAKPVFTVDYATMKTSEIVSDRIEYANDEAYTYRYDVGTSQAISLTGGASYWFRVKASNESKQFRSESSQLQVAPIPDAPNYTVDYMNEQTAEEIPESVEYAEDDQFTQNVQRGTGTLIAVVPGTDLWFRVAQTETSPSGEINHLVMPQRPAVPVHTIDYEMEQTLEPIATNEAYSSDAFVHDINEGRGDRLELSPGNAVWFSYPATESSFSSEKVKLGVKARPAKPVFTVDYATMKTSEIVSDRIEYANDAVYSQNYGVGDGHTLLLTSSRSYFFREMASNGNEQFRSDSYQLIVSTIPAAPQYMIDYLNELTVQEIPESVEYAEDLEFTQNIQQGAGEKIVLEPGNDLWFRLSKSNSHDSGEKFHLMVPERPLAPVVVEENDETNVFDWNWVDAFDQAEDYDFSVDGGESWKLVSEKPLPVGDLSLPAGMLQVRLSSHTDGDVQCFTGISLVSTIDFSLLTGIEDLDINISVYPNPVHDYVRIKLPGCQDGRLVLTNQQGKVVLIRRLQEESLTLNLSHLSSGIYFLVMEIDGSRTTKKIIKL